MVLYLPDLGKPIAPCPVVLPGFRTHEVTEMAICIWASATSCFVLGHS
jgi:hypothetical protein